MAEPPRERPGTGAVDHGSRGRRWCPRHGRGHGRVRRGRGPRFQHHHERRFVVGHRDVGRFHGQFHGWFRGFLLGSRRFGHEFGVGFRRRDLGWFVMPLTETLPVTEHVAQWDVWGTTARLVVDDPAALSAAHGLVVSQLRRVDDACNRFRPDSELSRLPPGEWTTVSADLAGLLSEALRAAERTDGDVDPTLGDAMAALGYDRPLAEFTTAGPPAIPVRVVTRARPGFRAVEVRGRRVRVPRGVHLDLGASAKASAADRCAALVADRLDVGVLVSLGGDLATAGPEPDGGWEVRVQDGPGEPSQVVRLPRGGALATSSTRSRRWRCGTRELHHVLDPRTLQPAEAVWRSVSVAAGSCLEANTASTAALVRGLAALPWLRSAGTSARLVGADGTVVATGRWPR